MLRRRRPKTNEAVHFSFDSFLDLVTNVVGIIIKLILITWVGARAYHSTMTWERAELAAPIVKLPPPKATDEPLYSKLEIAKAEIEEAKARLSDHYKKVEEVEEKTHATQAQLLALASQNASLQAEAASLAKKGTERDRQIRAASLSTDEIRDRAKKLLEEIKALKVAPGKSTQFKYHAPLSRTVHVDEMYFECKNGRVTFIDLPTFMVDIKVSMDSVGNELKQTWRVERVTPPVGAFRLRYVVERERSMLDGAPGEGGSFRYGVVGWVVEPARAERGESLTEALAEKSEFRRLVDRLDGNLTVVTFWVYPDSFDLFRHLRDHLYERNIDVAGRPLPPGASIAASRNGTASRGQ